MKWASRVKDISAEMLALAARVAPQSGIQALGQNKQVPQLVRDALNAGGDGERSGHRRTPKTLQVRGPRLHELVWATSHLHDAEPR